MFFPLHIYLEGKKKSHSTTFQLLNCLPDFHLEIYLVLVFDRSYNYLSCICCLSALEF